MSTLPNTPTTPTPFAVHHLDNGWTVKEFEHATKRVFYETDAVWDELGRFSVRLIRVPSERYVNCVHLIGATADERRRGLRIAVRNATAGPMSHPGLWARYKRPDGRTWMFKITLGDRINEASAFDEIALNLELEMMLESGIRPSDEVLGEIGRGLR